jgi:ATP-dependent helicase HrpB
LLTRGVLLLPILSIKQNVIDALKQHSLILLSAPPGAGKSTQLPLWLVQPNSPVNGKIYLLQPRRIAVKTIANYLAKQLNEPVGKTVGYRLRNETKVGKNTKLEVITEGILTQIIQHDPELAACSLVIFDEFHERSIQGDLAFALTRDCQQGLREDLSIMLMSATLDNQTIASELPDAFMLSCLGKCYPVDIEYHPSKNIATWREHTLKVIIQAAFPYTGSTLVFLPGVADIRYLYQQLKEKIPDDMILAPLYGDLTLAEQAQVIQPTNNQQRKLVLATNIAETSLTIDGISLVIDSGLEKVSRYKTDSLMNELNQQAISKSSAIQRMGRAGRLMAGKCIRLYSEEVFQRMPEQSGCEILQTDLMATLLSVAQWGVSSTAQLPFLTKPTAKAEQHSWQQLQQLGLVDNQCKLTKLGNQSVKLSCHPRLAVMLIKAKEISKIETSATLSLACIIAAMLEEKDIYVGEFARNNANIAHRIIDLCHWQNNEKTHQLRHKLSSNVTSRVLKQSKQLAAKLDHQLIFQEQRLPLDLIGCLVAFAYPERIAKSRSEYGQYLCQNGKGCEFYSNSNIGAEDTLANEEYLVMASLQQTKNKLIIRLAAVISKEQIQTYFKENIQDRTELVFDETSGRLQGVCQTKLGAISIHRQIKTQYLTAEQIGNFWCQRIKQLGLTWLPWQENDLHLLARWRWLNEFLPALGLPDVSEPALIAQLPHWFNPFIAEMKNILSFKQLDFSSMLLSLLDYQQQQQLNTLAPRYFVTPTGRKCLIEYGVERSPKVALPMQELYGQLETPSIAQFANDSGIPLQLSLLSPAGRPIQITQKLAEFWQGSYKQVQKEMKAKYPKHYWPDNPASAKPTNKTKRHLNIN